jgi:hypothetical protein
MKYSAPCCEPFVRRIFRSRCWNLFLPAVVLKMDVNAHLTGGCTPVAKPLTQGDGENFSAEKCEQSITSGHADLVPEP